MSPDPFDFKPSNETEVSQLAEARAARQKRRNRVTFRQFVRDMSEGGVAMFVVLLSFAIGMGAGGLTFYVGPRGSEHGPLAFFVMLVLCLMVIPGIVMLTLMKGLFRVLYYFGIVRHPL